MALPLRFEEIGADSPSPTGHWSRDGFEGTRRFLVPWEDIDFFVANCLGASGIFNTVPANFPGYSNVKAIDVKLKPASDRVVVPATGSMIDVDNDGGVTGDYNGDIIGTTNMYPLVEMEVTYRSLPPAEKQHPDLPDHPDGTYLEWDSDIAGEYMQTPGRSITWKPGQFVKDEVPPDVMPGVHIPTCDLILTWHFVAFPPIKYIRFARGSVNENIFLGAPPETVLFLGAKWKVSFELSGDSKYLLIYHFKEKSVGAFQISSFDPNQPGGKQEIIGWNHFWNPTEERIGTIGLPTHWGRLDPEPYPLANFNPLFQYQLTP